VSVAAALAELAGAWNATSPIERVAALLGFVYVLLAIRQHRACWLFALASTALYLQVFLAARLYMQAGLQAYYVVLAVYGWWAWRRRPAGEALGVTRAARSLQLAGVVLVLAVSELSALWLERSALSPAPYLDSLTTWGSVFATWLQARKKIDNWAWWFVIDALIVVLCWQQRLYPSMILYLLYVGLVVIGWRSWRADMQSKAAAAGAGE
jgi:nicotinamide mononucleotide transporter